MTAYSTASGEVALVFTYGRMNISDSAANSAHDTSARTVPHPAAASASFGRSCAYLRAMYVFTPTPVPTASAIITSCIGYMTESAVSASFEYMPTKKLSTML